MRAQKSGKAKSQVRSPRAEKPSKSPEPSKTLIRRTKSSKAQSLRKSHPRARGSSENPSESNNVRKDDKVEPEQRDE